MAAGDPTPVQIMHVFMLFCSTQIGYIICTGVVWL